MLETINIKQFDRKCLSEIIWSENELLQMDFTDNFF